MSYANYISNKHLVDFADVKDSVISNFIKDKPKENKKVSADKQVVLNWFR